MDWTYQAIDACRTACTKSFHASRARTSADGSLIGASENIRAARLCSAGKYFEPYPFTALLLRGN